MIAVNRPALELDATPRSATDLRLAGAVDLPHPGRPDRRRVPVSGPVRVVVTTGFLASCCLRSILGAPRAANVGPRAEPDADFALGVAPEAGSGFPLTRPGADLNS